MSAGASVKRSLARGVPDDHMLRQLFLLSANLMCVVDRDGILAVVNPAWYRMLGWAAHDILGLPFADLIHADDRDQVAAVFADMVARGHGEGQMESRVASVDDQHRWISWHATFDGTYWYGVGVDVTPARAAAERAETLALVVEGSDDAIVSQDLEHRITSWNAGAERLYGYTREEMLGRPAGVLIAEDRQDEEGSVITAALGGEKVSHFETQRVRKDGSVVDVSLTVSAMLGPDDMVLGISSVARDITSQRAAVTALHHSEMRLKQIVGATNEGVWQLDANNVSAFVNPQMAAMLGYTPDDMVGQPYWKFMSPTRGRQAEASLRGRRAGRPERMKFAFTRRDGSECHCVLSAAPLRDPDGTYAGSILVVTDLTNLQANEMPEIEAFLASVTTNMDEGVLGVDKRGTVAYANRRVQAMLDLPERQVLGLEAVALLREPGDGGPCPDLNEVWEAGRTVHNDDATIGVGGQRTPVSFHAWPRLVDGTAVGAVIMVRDITAQKAEEDRRERELDQLAWVGRTKDALDEGRLMLYAQPIVDIHTGAVVSHELLLRMRDPAGRVVTPDKFLPASERYGLMPAIDTWVVTHAMPIVAAGNAVEINLSAHTIGDPAMLCAIDAALAATEVDAKLVTFEVTETAVLQQTDVAAQFVEALRAHGCGVALDDFGTGFGSFTYLKRLPATTLKIDQQFVRNLADDTSNQHVVAAIVGLARGFGQKIVAEGVEQSSSADLLRAHGVDYGQGMLFGRPRPVTEVWPHLSL
jgi:PAS domain S-box-containing protein